MPLLKDLPLLGYFFGFTSRTETQQELVIVLQAEVVDQLSDRRRNPSQEDLLEQARERVRQRLNRFNDGSGDRLEEIEALDLIETDARDR